MNTRWLRSPLPDPFVLLAGGLFCGYLLMSRSFAHWGIRPLYVGEMTLGALLVGRPNSIVKPWLSSVVAPSQLSAFSWWFTISLTYGLFECLRAVLAGPIVMQTAEVMAFCVYPIYLFAGVWIGLQYPDLMSRCIVPLAWCHGLYGLAYVTFLAPAGEAHQYHESTAVDWFSHPAGCAILLLGLMAFERNPRRAVMPMILNVIVMLGMQRRAEWFAFLLAAALCAILTGHRKRILLYGAVMASPLLIGLVPGVRFPSPSIRGEDMSTFDVVGRAIAAVDPTSAANLTDNAEGHAETASWRSLFWAGIWKQVNASPSNMIFGLGFDFPLWQLHANDLTDSPVRTPHSIFMFVLGYSGWLGVLIFAGLQAALARMMWRTYRVTGEVYGFCLWFLSMAWALFDPLLETPFAAIPLYMLMGLSAAQAITADANAGRLKIKSDAMGSLLSISNRGAPLIRKPGLGSS